MKVCNFIIFFLAPIFVSIYGEYIHSRRGKKMYFNSCTCGENGFYTNDGRIDNGGLTRYKRQTSKESDAIKGVIF